MLSFIKIQSLYFRYSNLEAEIFSDLNVSFHEGWTSICGPNGAGKSTFLALVTGSLKPSAGTITVSGKLISVPQGTVERPQFLEDFIYDFSKEAIRFRESLGIADEWASRWESLSIGERKRLQIAIALSQKPDVLLVDEPTNHVDMKSKQVIFEALKQFKGTGLLVSHDRLLLNELCTTTALVELGTLKIFETAYDVAKKELSNSWENIKSQKETLKREEKKLNRAIQIQSEIIEKGKKNLSKKGISKKDHDAKEKVNLARVSSADSKDTQRKKMLLERGSRLSKDIENLRTKKEFDLGVFFETNARVRPLNLPEKVYIYDFIKIEQPEIYLNPGDKLAITGDNGAGKSTLLKSWMKDLKREYAYAPQEFSREETELLRDKLLLLDKETKGKVFTLVSCFGSSPKSLAAGSVPSPGVWQKLVIALAIINKETLLLLDEPTNHMDLDAVEVLEEALEKFEGIILCISHDQSFIDKVCNRHLHVSKGKVELL